MYKGMKKIIIGIDVSKEKIDVSHQDMDRQTVPAYLGKYENSPKGYKAMVKDLSRMHKGICPGQWLFCCETTGAYDRPMCYWLCANGFNVWRESALQIRWSLGIRRGKDDKAEDVIYAIRQSSKGMKDMKSSDWKQLYQAVDELYPLFKDRLLKELGNFTEQQMQVCYLMRIGLSKSQIQGMTNLSRVTVWRWVKKYDWVLTADDDEQMAEQTENVDGKTGVGRL